MPRAASLPVRTRLGAFNYAYDGNSSVKLSQSYPNGQTAEFSYRQLPGPASPTDHEQAGRHTDFGVYLWARCPTGRITSWSQQAGTQTPSLHSFGYDPADQLIAASVTAGGNVVNTFAYGYDPAGNRLTEQIDATTRILLQRAQ